MKKPRFGGDGGSSRADAEREAQEELDRLTRAGRPPASGPARSSYSPPPSSSPPPRSFTAPPSSRSPGMAGPVDDDYDEDDYDEVSGYSGPRNAKEEEEAVTELALRDWATERGRPDRLEDFARPRLDPTSVEIQRDRALRDIMERQERMAREYREQKARFQPSESVPEVSDIRAAHQMNVLRRGKPPGMMNMAAAQTGAFNKQRSVRATAADAAEAAEAAESSSKRGKKAPAKTASAKKARSAPSKVSARKSKSAPSKAPGGTAVKAKAAPEKEAGPGAKRTKAVTAKTAPPSQKAEATRAIVASSRKREPAAAPTPGTTARRGSAKTAAAGGAAQTGSVGQVSSTADAEAAGRPRSAAEKRAAAARVVAERAAARKAAAQKAAGRTPAGAKKTRAAAKTPRRP